MDCYYDSSGPGPVVEEPGRMVNLIGTEPAYFLAGGVVVVVTRVLVL